MLPADIHAFKQIAVMLCSNTNCVAPSAAKTLTKVHPQLLELLSPRISVKPHTVCPPWSSQNGWVVKLYNQPSSLPCKPTGKQIRVYCTAVSVEGKLFSCSLVANGKSFLLSDSRPILSSDSTLAALLALDRGLHCIRHSRNIVEIEIVCNLAAAMNFLSPSARQLSPLEAHLRFLLSTVQATTSVYKRSANSSEGIQIARALALTSVMKVAEPIKEEYASGPSVHQVKNTAREKAMELWIKEYNEAKESTCNAFFPSLTTLKKRLSRNVAPAIKQLISGHCCSLNAHLSRFYSNLSPGCSCGNGTETIEHFVFACPIYRTERAPLIEAALFTIGHWPTSLAALGEQDDLWLALLQFLKRSERLIKCPWRRNSNPRQSTD